MSRHRVIFLAIFLSSPLSLAFRLGDSGDPSVTRNTFTDAIKKATRQKPAFELQDDESVSPSSCTLVPISASIPTGATIPPQRRPVLRKKWGIDKDETSEYWFNNKIHTFGNTGFFGALHAAMAPLATKLIDNVAYDGLDARMQIAKKICESIKKEEARILDLCCGVGMSTRALQKACPDAEAVIGVDTSPEMIAMARFMTSHIEEMGQVKQKALKVLRPVLPYLANTQHYVEDMLQRAKTATSYVISNSQRTLFPDKSFDLVTVMYAFHEAPKRGRYLMLREARRLLANGGRLAIVDICPTYKPSPSMLAGEPYVLEYQKNIMHQIQNMKGFRLNEYQTIIPGHVVMWTLTRDGNQDA